MNNFDIVFSDKNMKLTCDFCRNAFNDGRITNGECICNRCLLNRTLDQIRIASLNIDIVYDNVKL